MTPLLASQDPNGTLLQYGAVGAIAVLSVAAVWFFIRDLVRQRNAAQADLRALHDKMTTDVVPVLTRVVEALNEFLEEQRRWRERERR